MVDKTLHQNLQKALRKYIEDTDTSANRIAKNIFQKNGRSISSAVLSQWFNDTYPGKVEKIDEAIQSFLERQEEFASVESNSIPFMMLTGSKRVFEICSHCHATNDLGLLTGRAGLGKTYALREYAQRNPGVIYIKANLSFTTKVLIKEIIKKLGLEIFGGIYDLLNKAIDNLKDSKRLLIIDEAENLPVRALDLTRTIWDDAEIGILLAGHPRLKENLRGRNGDFAYLWSRVGKTIELEPLKEADTEEIVKSVFPNSNGLYKTFHKESYANGRILKNLIFRSREVAALNNIEVNEDIVVEVAQKLILRAVR